MVAKRAVMSLTLMLGLAGAGLSSAEEPALRRGSMWDVVRQKVAALDLDSAQRTEIRRILHARRGELRTAARSAWQAWAAVADAADPDHLDEAVLRERVQAA